MVLRIVLFVSLLVSSAVVRGAIFLPDAAERTGYGPTLEAWSVFWSGACAERVAIEIGFTGHAEIQNMLPRVTSFARKAAPHVLKQCPKANIIDVSVPGRRASPPLVYLFEMHRSANWAVQNPVWYADRIRDTLAAGYLPADAGYHNALVRFEDGRFEGIYGKRLENHFSGSNVKRHMREDVTPTRLSHHTIAGYWYEHGSERENGQCAKSRDGYALWGSFTAFVRPGNSNVQMLRKYCAEADDKGHGDELHLSTPRPSSFDRDWGIAWTKFTDPLSERLNAMDLDTAGDAQSFAQTRKPLHESGALTLYPSEENWCVGRRIDAYYTVPSEDRNKAFGGNYAKALGERAKQVVNEYCGDAITASVSNYSEGDETKWDSMSFQFRPIRPSAFGNDDDYLELLDQHLSERAQAHLEYLNANHLGPACKDAPFCELPGGRYLNAIYNGRGDLVREMDQLERAEVNEMLSGQMAQLNMTENPITQLFRGVIEAEDGFIAGAANKYMYAYAAWGRQCLKSGAKTRTFVHTTPPTETINFDGSTDYDPGETYEADYTVNPEFFALLERVGSHYGAPDSDAPFLNKARRLVLKGLVQMKEHYDCGSPEVARFEKNLIALAQDDLNGRTLRVLPPPPAQPARAAPEPATQVSETPKAPQPSAPEPAEVEAPVAEAPTQSTPVQPPPATSEPAATAPTPTPTAAEPPTPTLSTAERYARMNAEVKTLSDAFVANITEANAAFQAEMQGASTDAERVEMLRRFNTEMAELRSRVESETQAIRAKYQE